MHSHIFLSHSGRSCTIRHQKKQRPSAGTRRYSIANCAAFWLSLCNQYRRAHVYRANLWKYLTSVLWELWSRLTSTWYNNFFYCAGNANDLARALASEMDLDMQQGSQSNLFTYLPPCEKMDARGSDRRLQSRFGLGSPWVRTQTFQYFHVSSESRRKVWNNQARSSNS